MTTIEDIRRSYVFLRTNNTIPDYVLEFIKSTCIAKIEGGGSIDIPDVKDAVTFIGQAWPKSNIPLPIREQWAELMEAYHQSKVESVTDERERLKEFIRWNNQHNGIATPVPLKMADNYLERK